MQQISMLDVNSGPTEFTLYVTNYSHLLDFKQRQLRLALFRSFGVIPQECGGMLKIYLSLLEPIHSGRFMRRLEMVIFQLRCSIDPLLRFEQYFIYGA